MDILPNPQVNKLSFNVTPVRLAVLCVTFDVQMGKLRHQWSGYLIKVTGAETADEGSNPSQLSQSLFHLYWSVGHASLCHLPRDPTPVTLKSARGGGIHNSGLCLFLVWAASIHCVHSCQRSTRLSDDTTVSLPALSLGVFKEACWLSNTLRTCLGSRLCLNTIGRKHGWG